VDSRTFRNKKRECLKENNNDLEMNSMNKNTQTYTEACIYLRSVTNPELTKDKLRRGIWFQTSALILTGGRITSVSR
jgi:hypothetical protein